MNSITKIAFYYTVLVTTLIACASFFYIEMPYSLFQTIILLPSILYMWLRITDPQKATEASWSIRLVLVMSLLLGIGVFSMYLLKNREYNKIPQNVSNGNTETASLSAQIKDLKQELNSLKDIKASQDASPSAETETQIADLINSLPSPTPSINPYKSTSNYIKEGQLSVVSLSGSNVYKEDSVDSKIIGIAENGKLYDYFDTSDYESFEEWYLIEFEDNLYGWVQAVDIRKKN